jgi:HEAT repeat protein
VGDALVAAGSTDAGRPLVLAAMRGILNASAAPAAAGAAWVLGELRATEEAQTIVAAMRRGTLTAAAGLQALRGAGTVQEVPIVLEYVADTSQVVRAEAISAAAELLDPEHPDGRAVEPLTAALKEPAMQPAEQARLAGLLGRTGAPRAAPVLVDLAHAHDPTLALAAIDALGTLGPTGLPAVDDALLGMLSSPDAPTRLHAAVALSEAAGPRARDALLGKLDGGDEVDRASVLTAMGGVIARVPTEAAVARLAEALALAAGPERDGAVEAIGRAQLPSAVRALADRSRSDEVADRRVVASLGAAHAGDGQALTMVRMLAADAEASVRAQAAWSLGTVGDASDIPRLVALAKQADSDGATNAAAAIGRILARTHGSPLAARPEGDRPLATSGPHSGPAASAATDASLPLCGLLVDLRPYVRANALAGIAMGGLRCGDGGTERALLAEDPNEDVRAAAASALSASTAPDDRRSLERCARSDPSGTVAIRCRARPAQPAHAHAALVYVIPEGAGTPRPGAAYAMLLSDGTIHAGTADRRGAVFDPVMPEGTVTLRPASAMAR